jgi:hypothetical protein
MFVLIANAMLFWQEPPNLISRIWTYLKRSHSTFGRITISVSSVLVGLIVVLLTIPYFQIRESSDRETHCTPTPHRSGSALHDRAGS